MTLLMMTPAQRKALNHPCLLACETMHPRFTHRSADRCIRITVNTGYE